MRKYPARDAAAKLGHSEMGGAPGIVQPAIAPDGSPGHEPTPSERAALDWADPAPADPLAVA